MKNIVLFTKQDAIKKHWNNALAGKYNRINIQEQEALFEYLESNTAAAMVMIDEDSLSHLKESIVKLKSYSNATIIFLKSVPEVYHAASIVGQNIKAYENAFINKYNLLTMLENLEEGKSWLFSELTHYIISKFIQEKNTKEPDFMPLLTQTEKDIAIMVANGLSNKEIAQAKGTALSTVKGHMRHIFEKAGVTDRVSLALKFK